MANYCNNWAIFSGDKEALTKVYNDIEKAMDLNKENYGLIWYETFFVALDIPFKEKLDTYEEFGSKWFQPELSWNGDDLVISGDSAWSPVSQFFLKLSEKYNLKFVSEFEEAGCDFGGYFDAENGVVTKDETYSYRQYQYLEKGIENMIHEAREYYDVSNIHDALDHFDELKGCLSDEEWGAVYKELLKEFD